MQSYGDFRLIPTKQTISGREACGAYTKNAAEMAMLAITVAKLLLSFFVSFYILYVSSTSSQRRCWGSM